MLNRLFQHRTQKNALSPNSVDYDILEKKLEDPCATPMYLPLDFLKSITRNFSKEQELGRGGFGVVYKGILRDRKTIAVKKFSEVHLDDDRFQNEVTYLIGLKHENIVQLLGYCAESRWEAVQVGEKYVMAEIRHRLICFEYLNNKSLDEYISAESCGLEWHKRFEIIRRICFGLHYLHKECNIVHLDLTPQNILLDDNMLPKIADFGMSRLFGQQQSRVITQNRLGTLGYMAPEYIDNGLISFKSDIFSLGVIIIELLIGSRDYRQSSEASFEHFIENKWRNRFEKTSKYTPFEIYSQQVHTCTAIGLRCVDSDPNKRPSAWDIIEMLNAIESENRRSGVNGGPLVDEAVSNSFFSNGKGSGQGNSNGAEQLSTSFANLKEKIMQLAASCEPISGGGCTGFFSSCNGVLLFYGYASTPAKRALMEDFYDTQIDSVDGVTVQMFGVYDGHGGAIAAEYVKEHLFSNLIKHPEFITDTKAAISETYNHTDSEFLKADSLQAPMAGSTAVTAIIVGDRLLVANVGDSRAIICKGGQAIAVSRDHKPDQTDERQRIEDAGGFVMWDGTWRVGGLVPVSRAFGNKLLKQYVLADPEVKEEVLDSSHEFLILASHGLWDVVTNEEAVEMVKPIQDAESAAKRLLQEAYKRETSENTTVIIVRFR
ncbi:unnamed protein product [Urochloa decumbens]|uniref:protein-serine/threonine phosphatase n=1 Tax=Urochloa decumbens TaxID=240449 RepID=A0ABC9B7W6_9POAL